jgi:hypothetical protein
MGSGRSVRQRLCSWCSVLMRAACARLTAPRAFIEYAWWMRLVRHLKCELGRVGRLIGADRPIRQSSTSARGLLAYGPGGARHRLGAPRWGRAGIPRTFRIRLPVPSPVRCPVWWAMFGRFPCFHRVPCSACYALTGAGGASDSSCDLPVKTSSGEPLLSSCVITYVNSVHTWLLARGSGQLCVLPNRGGQLFAYFLGLSPIVSFVNLGHFLGRSACEVFPSASPHDPQQAVAQKHPIPT